MKYNEMTFGQMEAVINKLGGYEETLRFLRGELVVSESAKKIDTVNPYTLTINYTRSIEDGIKAGKYDWTNSDITSSHFPSSEVGTKEVSVELVHFGKDMTIEEVLSELDKAGMRPTTLKELLVLGEKYPDLQREFPIIALASVWQNPRGVRRCAYLVRFGSRRDLDWRWVGRRWLGLCRFAAVRK
ncbi:MAG: hypothetical protein Q7S78_02315 [Candidatus Azambacteria bacterium]|nr:hypothetical protein [Candidatus Azambacteria bacterium]